MNNYDWIGYETGTGIENEAFALTLNRGGEMVELDILGFTSGI